MEAYSFKVCKSAINTGYHTFSKPRMCYTEFKTVENSVKFFGLNKFC